MTDFSKQFQAPSENPTPVVIITGAAGGIGRAIATRFARHGYHLSLVDVSPISPTDLPPDTLRLQGSVTSAEDVARIVRETMGRWDRIDVLVNNAGITRDALLTKMTDEQWDSVLEVNLKGCFRMGQAVALQMKAQSTGGRLIHLASISARGNVGQSNYAAAKAGLIALSNTWALELARYGITSNAVAPGFIDTEMTAAMPPEIRERIVQKTPLKRMGRPEDIAETVAFLAGPGGAFITGQCIGVDGGLSTGLGV